VEVLVTAALVLVAYVAGLWSFKIKSRWCAVCGAVKSCPNCAGWAAFAAPAGSVPIDRTDPARSTGQEAQECSTRTGAGRKGDERR
jgi:hypothetical protein